MDNEDFIPTKASQLNKKAKKPEMIIHSDSRKSVKKKDSVKDKMSQNDQADNESEKIVLDMKRARHEIIKFGMAGFTPAKKKKAKVELAVRLGAKPPKNKYRNYREILSMRKNQKKQKQEILKLRELGKNVSGKLLAKKNKKPRRKEKLPGILDVYGKPSIKT